MDTILIIVAGIAGVAFLIVSILAGITARRRRQEAMGHCRYRPKKSLMVGSERRCFQLLNDIFGQRFYIIPQVDVSALLNHVIKASWKSQSIIIIEWLSMASLETTL